MQVKLELIRQGKKQETLDVVISETEFYKVKSGETLTAALPMGTDGSKLSKVVFCLDKNPDKDYGCKLGFDKPTDEECHCLVHIPAFQLDKAKEEKAKLMVARRDTSVKELKLLDYVNLIYQN